MKYAKILVTTLVIGLIAPISVTFAEGQQKVGYVNLTRVFFEYEKSKELKKSLEDKAKLKDSERKRMVDDIKRLKDEAELLSDKAKSEKDPVIDDKIRTLQEFDTKTKEEIAKEGSSSSGEVLDDIEGVINDYAKKQGYSMIIDSEALLYGDDAGNLTDPVIKLLNDGYKNNSLPKAKKDVKK